MKRISLPGLIIWVAMVISGTATAGSSMQQAVLESLYNATDGPNWSSTASPKWLSNQNYCKWGGVKCNPDRSVARLDLSSRGLSGTIPSTIRGLAWLELLDLTANPLLSGTIPSTIGNLNALTQL